MVSRVIPHHSIMGIRWSYGPSLDPTPIFAAVAKTSQPLELRTKRGRTLHVCRSKEKEEC